MRIGILIPAYNAQRHIAAVVRDCLVQAREVVVIDDGSSDETATLAEKSGALVLRLPVNSGKGSALQRGFAYALEQQWDACLTVDADGQHHIADIPKFVAAHEHDPHALILGNRLWHKMPWPSRFTRCLSLIFLSLGSGTLQHDSQCGFRLYPMQAMQRMRLRGKRYELESEVLLTAGRKKMTMRYIPIETIYFKGTERQSHFRAWKDTWRIIFTFFGSLMPGWTSKRWITHLALVFALALGSGTGCFSKSTHLAAPWIPLSVEERQDPQRVAEAISKTQPALQTLQAEINLEIRGIKPAQPSLSGEMVMSKAEGIRVRTYSPLGPMAFELLYKADHLELYLPQRQEVVMVPVSELQNLQFGGSPLRIPKPENWWLMVEPWPAVQSTETIATMPDPENPAQGTVIVGSRRYTVDWNTGRILRLEISPRENIIYSDWKTFVGRDCPTVITYQMPNPEKADAMLALVLRIRNLKDNPLLGPAVFESVNAPALKVTRLGGVPPTK